MSLLTLSVTINSSQTDGNVTSWAWLKDNQATDFNPPPRMSISDTLKIVLTDTNGSGPTSFGGYAVVSAKVENPRVGQTGKASPFKLGNNTNNAAVCAFSWSAIQASGGTFTFTPANNVMLEKGAWELTFVASRSDTGAQFEIDPEFDIGN